MSRFFIFTNLKKCGKIKKLDKEKVMKISSKGRHAVRIMVDIATDAEELTSIPEMAKRLDITPKYLEQIILKLTKAKLLAGSRGFKGGYKLNKNPEEITIAQILSATGDMPKLAPCLVSDKDCPAKTSCTSIGVWETLSGIIYKYLNKVTLTNLIEKTYPTNLND